MLKGVKQDPTLEVTLDQIDKAFDAIGKAINLVYQNLINTTQIWNLVSDYDVTELIYHLKLSVIYKDITEREKDWIKESELWHNSKYFKA